MTANTLIAEAVALTALSLILTGLILYWQAWRRSALLEWPPSVLVALGTTPLLVGMALGQITLFRLFDVPHPFGPNDPFTVVFRWIVAAVVTARLVRVARGRLLTTADRERLNGGGP